MAIVTEYKWYTAKIGNRESGGELAKVEKEGVP